MRQRGEVYLRQVPRGIRQYKIYGGNRFLCDCGLHHGLFDCVDVEHADLFSKSWTELKTMTKHAAMQKQEYLDGYEWDEILRGAAERIPRLLWSTIKKRMGRLKP